MKVLKNKRSGYTVSLEIEEDYAEIEKATDAAFQEVVKEVKVPGFRPGKVPRQVFEKNFGKEIILDRASTIVMNNCYRQAIEQEKLKPIDYPKDVKVDKFDAGKPLVFSLAVEVVPEIKLGKYKGIKIAKDSPEVTEKDVQEQITRLRESYADYKDADRPVQKEDFVSYDIKAFDGDQPVAAWTREKSGTKVGVGQISPEFDEELIGLKKNEPKSFKLKFKKDYHLKEAAGKEIRFEVLITEIKEKVLPEMNDELAKKISGKETLAELTKEIKEHLEKTKKEQVENKFKDELLKEIVKENSFEVPKAMIEEEVGAMLNNLSNQLSQSKLKLEDYAAMMGKDLESLKAEYRPLATERVQLKLILEEVAKAEEIKPTDEEFDKELAKISDNVKKPLEEVKKNLNPYLKEHINKYLIEEKTLEFLVNNAKIK